VGGKSRDEHPLYSPNAYIPITPIAVAGHDVDIEENGTVLFDSTGSLDDVEIKNYTWTFTYNGNEITLTGAAPNFTFKIPGIYKVILTVTDAQGNVGMDVMYVTVFPEGELPSPDDDDPEDDYGEGRETSTNIGIWICMFGAVLLLGLMVLLMVLFLKKKSEERDTTTGDELGRSRKDDGIGDDG